MKQCQVTVIVLVYNPIWEKLKSTLLSILCQQNIKYQIILSDDGSEQDCFDQAIDLFKKHHIDDYKLIKNKTNLGTVKNTSLALLSANGEYTYIISPGDMLYDNNTLKNLYDFAIGEQIDVCFGNAIYYNLSDNKPHIISDHINAPARPWLFAQPKKAQTAFFTGNYILGATFFRKTEIAIKYMRKIENISRYVEDNTTTAFMLADGIRIHHFDNYVIWYEYGVGVSTNQDERWKKLLEQDFENCFRKMYDQYNDNTLRILLNTKKITYKLCKIIYLLFCSPSLLLQILKIHSIKKSIGYSKQYNTFWLAKFLNSEGESNASD